jgi:hypothetical protein
MTVLLTAALLLTLAACVRPRRPVGMAEGEWRAHVRLMGRAEWLRLFALLAWIAVFVAVIGHIANAAYADRTALERARWCSEHLMAAGVC